MWDFHVVPSTKIYHLAFACSYILRDYLPSRSMYYTLPTKMSKGGGTFQAASCLEQ